MGTSVSFYLNLYEAFLQFIKVSAEFVPSFASVFIKLVFVFGHLNTATSRSSRGTPVKDLAVENDESDIGVEFIDVDDFPLACIHPRNSCFDHPVSKEELGYDFFSAESSVSEAQEELEGD